MPEKDAEEQRKCDHCDSEWEIKYDPEQGTPEVCPFCGAEALPLDSEEESDYDDSDKEYEDGEREED
jgi:hypothetical protein